MVPFFSSTYVHNPESSPRNFNKQLNMGYLNMNSLHTRIREPNLLQPYMLKLVMNAIGSRNLYLRFLEHTLFPYASVTSKIDHWIQQGKVLIFWDPMYASKPMKYELESRIKVDDRNL